MILNLSSLMRHVLCQYMFCKLFYCSLKRVSQTLRKTCTKKEVSSRGILHPITHLLSWLQSMTCLHRQPEVTSLEIQAWLIPGVFQYSLLEEPRDENEKQKKNCLWYSTLTPTAFISFCCGCQGTKTIDLTRYKNLYHWTLRTWLTWCLSVLKRNKLWQLKR